MDLYKINEKLKIKRLLKLGYSKEFACNEDLTYNYLKNEILKFHSKN